VKSTLDDLDALLIMKDQGMCAAIVMWPFITALREMMKQIMMETKPFLKGRVIQAEQLIQTQLQFKCCFAFVTIS